MLYHFPKGGHKILKGGEYPPSPPPPKKDPARHHDQTTSIQAAFAKDVRSLVSAIEDLGNPFEEESTDLLVLDTKEIADHTSVEDVQNARRIGQEQFQAYIRDCLIERSKSIDDVIHRNKLKLFGSAAIKNVSKGKQQLTSLKSDVGLFSRLYIGCQTRDGNLAMKIRLLLHLSLMVVTST